MKATFFILSMVLISLLYCKEELRPVQSTQIQSQINNRLTLVDAKYVCMPQNKIFQREMLSVKLDGKTYYGCCKGCINSLRTEPNKHRYGTDSLTGKKVDKALAVIVNSGGSALYFSSKENAHKYAKQHGHELALSPGK